MQELETNSKKELVAALEGWYAKVEKVVIALSGGIDSSLVAYTARKVLGRDHVVAIISASASVKMKELNDARTFTKRYDITLKEVDAREIEDENYVQNPINRCYFCKSALYSKLDSLIEGKYKDYTVLNGNNYSDFGDYRPGLEAAEQHKVLSPLAECKFTKDNIREVAQYYNLPNWNKPASPCLSSRFPYGESITQDKLKMVEKAEDVLNTFGFDDVRVRYTNAKAMIEVPAPELMKLRKVITEISPKVLSFGFTDCEIDQEGLVSGKLNRSIGRA